MISSYQPPNKKHWKGRSSDKTEYWHQSIALTDLFKETEIESDIALIGYQCEEGVRRNLGRLGTKDGPNAIRDLLGKLPIHRSDILLADCGDLVFNEKVSLETFQKQFSGHIARLVKSNSFSIALGGGHDISYGHFCGVHEALHKDGKRFGIINFDAHFDLRSAEHSTSGTPFYQILEEFGDHTFYTALGIQQSSNTQELFDYAGESHSRYLPLAACTIANIQESYALIDELANNVDYIYVTVDMDGFSSAFSPGVSAPSPFGLTPDYVKQVLKYLMGTNKVVALDFAESNPIYDIDNSTARLAAKLIWEVVQEKS